MAGFTERLHNVIYRLLRDTQAKIDLMINTKKLNITRHVFAMDYVNDYVNMLTHKIKSLSEKMQTRLKEYFYVITLKMLQILNVHLHNRCKLFLSITETARDIVFFLLKIWIWLILPFALEILHPHHGNTQLQPSAHSFLCQKNILSNVHAKYCM